MVEATIATPEGHEVDAPYMQDRWMIEHSQDDAYQYYPSDSPIRTVGAGRMFWCLAGGPHRTTRGGGAQIFPTVRVTLDTRDEKLSASKAEEVRIAKTLTQET